MNRTHIAGRAQGKCDWPEAWGGGGLRPFATASQLLRRGKRQCGVVDESDADDMEPLWSLELMDPEDIELEDIEPDVIAPWAAAFFFLCAFVMWSPEVIALPLDISAPDDMEPLDIAPLELEEPFDIAPLPALCAIAAPATPTLNSRASPVILAW